MTRLLALLLLVGSACAAETPEDRERVALAKLHAEERKFDEMTAKLHDLNARLDAGTCTLRCDGSETPDEKVARLETELRLARAARAVNAGIGKAARKRVRRE